MNTTRLIAILAYSAAVLLIARPVAYSPSPVPAEQVRKPRTVQLALAGEVIRGAVAFNAAQVGFAGITPTEVLAWRVILQSPGRDSVFRDLLETATSAGQLYALAGLRYGLYVVGTDSSEYWSASARLSRKSQWVLTTIGCIGSRAPLNELVKQIDSGSWTSEFIAGRLLNHH